jgi:transcriptional regulator with XRE-family HTH domain
MEFTFTPVVPIGTEVRALRENAGLTQKQFAELLMTSVDRIKKYENGTHAMTACMWLLARISCDALIRAQWNRALPKHAA